MTLSHLLTSATIIVTLSSCAATRQQKQAKTEPAEKPAPQLFAWDGPSIQGKPKVRINLSEQKAHIFDNGQEVAWTYVATGVEDHPTPTGTFEIMEKIADKHSNLWGIVENADGETVNWNANSRTSHIPSGGRFVGAPMPHWMRLTGYGVGMHGGPIPEPGSPASHGCIRLPYEMATKMFEELPSGTPVTITD